MRILQFNAVVFYLFRHRRPGYFKRLAMDREVTMDCLHYYNLNHPVRDLSYHRSYPVCA